MTRYQTRWVNVIIIALVVILRLPTLLPSMYESDEGYYGTIANDILDGGAVYQTAVDTKPPGMYYIYAAVFKVAGKNNLLAVHVLAILVVAATALVVRRIGARVADDWAGAWSGIGYAVFVHAYRPDDTLGANTEIFASLFLALSVLVFLQGQRKAGFGFDVSQWRPGRGSNIDPAAFGRDLGRNAGVSRLWLAHSPQPLVRTCFGSRQRCRDWIHCGDCGTGLVLPVAGKSS